MIILAKANITHKFSIFVDEQKYRENFLDKQPLLFEPEHALALGLLTYQERLKNYL